MSVVTLFIYRALAAGVVLVLNMVYRVAWRESSMARKVFWNQHVPELKGEKDVVWIHCASVGEFEDVRCLIDLFCRDGHSIFLTFQSPSAFNKIKSYPGVQHIAYLPIDSPSNAREFLRRVRPVLAVFSRSEFWLNYLNQLRSENIAAFVVGFRVTNSNLYALPFIRWFYQACFQCCSHMFCENESTLKYLQTHFQNINGSVTGNPRLDRIRQIVSNANSDLDFLQMRRIHPVVVLGSIEPSDFEMTLAQIASMTNPLHWLVVPHHVDEGTLQRVESFIQKPVVRFSRLSRTETLPDVVLVDTVGLLAQLYRGASAAYVGGGFAPKGIHSVLEPALHGVPTACGPNHRNYSDVLALIERGGVQVCNHQKEFQQWLARTLGADAENARHRVEQYVQENLGASVRNYEAIIRLSKTSAQG